ncbi:unnamed protein product [Protopolystoma xenopodis]|uniref:Uncharacterized protein n=1 Tax=Protopolystoma xenopodis TaxID=117903 RepID=A0A448WYB9_9PLAT|nr:unnamed protein product [Protopolystoma xenopodis]
MVCLCLRCLLADRLGRALGSLKTRSRTQKTISSKSFNSTEDFLEFWLFIVL